MAIHGGTMLRMRSQALHAFRTSHGKVPPFSAIVTCTWRGYSSRYNDNDGHDRSYYHMISGSRSVAQKKLNGVKAHFSSFPYNREKGTQGQAQLFEIQLAKRFATKMSGKGPGLIVFDLDCTLWPLHVDTTVNPPFIKTDSKIVDQDGKLITYYPEVPQVLEYLKSEGYPIGVASRTTKPPGALQLLDFFDWNKYISYQEIYPGSKVTHFNKFVEQSKLAHKDMLFFDDEERNIIDMEKEGVKCVLVRNGVDLQLVKDSIEQFKNGKL